MNFSIIGGEIVNASGNRRGNIVVKDGKIESIEKVDRVDESLPIVDATDYYILPGMIDLNQSFDVGDLDRNDNRTGWEHACISSGITSVVVDQSSKDIDSLSFDYCYRTEMLLEQLNPDSAERLLSLGIHQWIIYCNEKYNIWYCDWRKIHSIIVGKSVQIWLKFAPNETINRSTQKLLHHNQLSVEHFSQLFHSVDQTKFVEQAIELAQVTGIEIGLMDVVQPKALKHVKQARKQHVPIKLHLGLPYLLYSNEKYKSEEALDYVCNPALVSENDRVQLLRYVKEGMVTTLSNYYSNENKSSRERMMHRLPNRIGINKQESFIDLLKHNNEIRFSLNDFVKLVSRNPARMLGCYPQKGIIQPHSDADFIFVHRKELSIDYTFIKGNCLKNKDTISLHIGLGERIQLNRLKRFTY